jgi:LEA14-like dessication related protein
MKPRAIAPWIAVVTVAAVLAGCQALQQLAAGIDKPTARLAGVGIDDLGPSAVTLRFDVDVTNPYAVDLPLVGLDYSLASGGKTFLTGKAEPGADIPARGHRTIAVPARISIPGLLGLLAGVKPGSMVPYAADVTVSVDAPGLGRLGLPLHRQGEVPVPAIPEVSLSGIRVHDVGLNGASATVDLRLRNTNVFPLDLTSLSYALGLGGSPALRGEVERTVSIGPSAESVIPIDLSLSTEALGAAALKALSGGGTSWSLSGSLRAGTPYGPIVIPLQAAGQTGVERAGGGN